MLWSLAAVPRRNTTALSQTRSGDPGAERKRHVISRRFFIYGDDGNMTDLVDTLAPNPLLR